MPIYEYICTECGFEKDCLQKLSDPVLTECPSCKKSTFKKKISAPSFRLKGDGWYETDFKTRDKKNLASSDNDEQGGVKEDSGAKDSGAKDNPKTDSKSKSSDSNTSSTATASSTTGASSSASDSG